MSCSYADGLSPYDNKGVLGLPEKFDSSDKVKEKCVILTEWIKQSKFVVIHTGAGISTSAGIPDFRGPNGVWTLERKGLKPNINVSFADAMPTKTHMVLKKLVDEKLVHYVISQNIDGLHLKSGLKREHLAELHGNMFIEQCNVCKRQFVRSTPAPTVGQKHIGLNCHNNKLNGRPCRGKLHDVILDWEHNLPDDDLDIADMTSCIADLSICLGTTLQIVPSGNLPLNTLKYGGKLVVCNLQPTKHDNKADLIINSYVDDILENVMKNLGLEIPKYNSDNDPTNSPNITEWTISKKQLQNIKKMYKKQCDGVPKRRVLVKKSQEITEKYHRKKIKLENNISNDESLNSSNEKLDIKSKGTKGPVINTDSVEVHNSDSESDDDRKTNNAEITKKECDKKDDSDQIKHELDPELVCEKLEENASVICHEEKIS